MVNDMCGIICEQCGRETFQVRKRRVIKIIENAQVCKTCAMLIDIDDAEKRIKKTMSRVEHHKLSVEWANSLHGKHVVVCWVDNVHPTNFHKLDLCDYRNGVHQIKGTAYRIQDGCGGWAQLRVDLDSDELYRVKMMPDYFWSNHQKILTMKARIDGHEWGIYLEKNNGNGYHTYVGWGSRRTIREIEGLGCVIKVVKDDLKCAKMMAPIS